MNKDKFIRLSGWALIVGAFAWVLGIASVKIQEYNPYNALSRPFEKYFQYTWWEARKSYCLQPYY